MANATVTERSALLDNEVAEREAREAAWDLERIEEDAKREAEAYVEVKDLDGNEKASVEAAGSAFDLSQAELDTAMIAGQVEENLDWESDAGRDVLNSMKDVACDMQDNVKGAVRSAKDTAKEAVESIQDRM